MSKNDEDYNIDWDGIFEEVETKYANTLNKLCESEKLDHVKID